MQAKIILENVSVRYRLPKERIRTIKEYAIQSLWRRVDYEEFWGLTDISMQVAEGETLGIIGCNGAGKSTLLKLVAGIIKPVDGRFWSDGKVAPLIELGAGFDTELTGLENIYLSSSILGVSRAAMQPRVPEIIEFSGLQEFIDSPLRTYSTGMMVRLGFAIATACDPEILLLDEVLAVGDANFQQKSFARINSFRESGATTLLVSHDLGKVKELCHRTLWLDRGKVAALGETGEVVALYEAANQARHA
jgi:ABC-type polysaccharide/polyol phosphate transport system ATPase subunit